MVRSTSKSSQTDLPAESSAVLGEIVEETFENATKPQPSMSDEVPSVSELESARIQSLGSRPNSPGVDPRQAMPISGDDAAELREPLVQDLGSLDGPPHKALTAHLPPKDVQERHMKEMEKTRDQKNLSIHLPPRDGGRLAEPLSSPSSTIDAHSATTPALHEASTDTSPENEARYDVEGLENGEHIETPPELKKSVEERAEQARHDRIHQAQMDIAQAQILKNNPVDDVEAEEQNRRTEVEDSTGEDDEITGQDESLTKEAKEVAEDVEDDQANGYNMPTEDESMTGVQNTSSDSKITSSQKEVADSDAEDQTPPVDSMDVDVSTVQDSFESNNSTTHLGDTTSISPTEVDVTAQPVTTSAASSTSVSKNASTSSAPPPLERMTTRVASGAIRHKSVSEILGEIPRPNTASSDRGSQKGDNESAVTLSSPSRSSTPLSPGNRMRTLVEKAKDKERSKLSTVVFAKQPTRPASKDNALMPGGSQALGEAKNDYFTPLFLAASSTAARGPPPLDSLLATAHKTLTTANAYVPINEHQTSKVLKRIYGLQNAGKWTLRQAKRSDEPQRPKCHWDVVLQEAKWMRTDFREERKWKMAVARNLVYACAEWHEASPEDKKLLQVNACAPTIIEPKDVEMGGTTDQANMATPDLVASEEFESPIDDFDEEPRLNLLETVAPTDIFGLQDDDVVFGLRQSPSTDRLLKELPLYGAPLMVPSTDPSKPDLDPDRYWRREALPLSKYVEGIMTIKNPAPPRKKSRFEYDDDSDDDEDQDAVFGEQNKKKDILAPESTEVALFNPEHKHIRDRIHAGHQFRPPSEYQMPLQSFFECRTPSQWTYAEDDTLKQHVRDYSYNWSLIANLLTSPSLFSSGAERRTPWECFERWICLEGLPADMHKTAYFRAYNSRLEAANRAVLALAAQPPQPNAQGQLQQQPRRRTTASIRVERRRNQKYLSMVDTMRKMAKKREATALKHQNAAQLAAMRKANEQPQARNVNKTPQDFSRMKFEQNERMKEQYAVLQQRQQAQARVC